MSVISYVEGDDVVANGDMPAYKRVGINGCHGPVLHLPSLTISATSLRFSSFNAPIRSSIMTTAFNLLIVVCRQFTKTL